MSDERRQDQTGPAGPAPEEGQRDQEKGSRAHIYAARRLSWISGHGRDDRFLIFVGVAVLAVTIFYVAYKIIEERQRPPEHPPVPLVKLFYAPAEEIRRGVVRITYDFKIDPRISYVREACPQLSDWEITGTVDNHGILVSGDNRHRPFFAKGNLSVECDAALVFGTQIAVALRGIHDGQEGDFYRFELNASRGNASATARLSEWREGSRVQGSKLVEIGSLRARRDPPLFYKVKLELAGGILRGYFAPRGGELEEVCELPASDLAAGIVMLQGPGSQTAFDNVVITGRPHAVFVEKRTKLYHLFPPEKKYKGPGPGGTPPAESGPPARG